MGVPVDPLHSEPALPGLLGHKELLERRDLLTGDNNEHVDEQGTRCSEFKGLDVRLGDMAGRDPNHHRILDVKGDKQVLLMRNGFVINMTKGLPPEYVQPTLGLLYAAMVQATEETDAKPGIHDVRKDYQDIIYDTVREDLAAKGLDLDAPDFEKAPPLEY